MCSVVAEKEACAAVQSATIAADKVQLVVDVVKYRRFVEDNSMVDSLVTGLLSLLGCLQQRSLYSSSISVLYSLL
jgi:hypothetical protein